MEFERGLQDNRARVQVPASVKTEALQVGYLSSSCRETE